VTDKHAQMREMARDLIRNSVIEDAIAQRIAQIVEFIHEDRIKPLQERVEMLEERVGTLEYERAMDKIAAIKEDTPTKKVQWINDYDTILPINGWYSARKYADDNARNGRIAVIRREWVEGQLPQYFTEEV
jgi:hypothetical protein